MIAAKIKDWQFVSHLALESVHRMSHAGKIVCPGHPMNGKTLFCNLDTPKDPETLKLGNPTEYWGIAGQEETFKSVADLQAFYKLP